MMEIKDKNNASMLLRLPEDLKAALQREAYANGRRITSEINTRLRESLKNPSASIAPSLPAGSQNASNVAQAINENGEVISVSEMDRAVLNVFHKLTPEKQLALLSLFR